MTTQQETKYKVQSLERGLLILRELRASNAPVRNQDLVKRTQLPKATVSRLLNTLTALGCVRRIDQGSYVLDHASGRSGRAMISSLGLEKYAELLSVAPGPVYLEALVGGHRMPVYRWAGTCGPLVNGYLEVLGPEEHRSAESGDYWDESLGTWWAWIGFQLHTIGHFSLAMQVAQSTAPTRAQIEDATTLLNRAAKAMIQNELQ
jgi:hypothetical protein